MLGCSSDLFSLARAKQFYHNSRAALKDTLWYSSYCANNSSPYQICCTNWKMYGKMNLIWISKSICYRFREMYLIPGAPEKILVSAIKIVILVLPKVPFHGSLTTEWEFLPCFSSSDHLWNVHFEAEAKIMHLWNETYSYVEVRRKFQNECDGLHRSV